MGSSKERALSKIVRSTTLETFAPNIAANELGLVKNEVEGFESEVISGMSDAREKLPVILMEFRSWKSNKEVSGVPLVQFLLDNNHVLDTAEALYPRWRRRVAKDGFPALSERLDGQEFKKTDLLLVHRNLPGAPKLVETLAALQF